jgi:hypothetical protein
MELEASPDVAQGEIDTTPLGPLLSDAAWDAPQGNSVPGPCIDVNTCSLPVPASPSTIYGDVAAGTAGSVATASGTSDEWVMVGLLADAAMPDAELGTMGVTVDVTSESSTYFVVDVYADTQCTGIPVTSSYDSTDNVERAQLTWPFVPFQPVVVHVHADTTQREDLDGGGDAAAEGGASVCGPETGWRLVLHGGQ